MLDESTHQKEDAAKQSSSGDAKVTCFVCKREVDREQTKRIPHSKEKQVWVCQAHIK